MSTPGNCYSLRIGFGTESTKNDTDVLSTTQLILHPPNEFIYFKEQDKMPDNLKIDVFSLKENEAAVFTLKKIFSSSLSRPESHRPCVDDKSYSWGNCLDNLFYIERGCQDPWYVNKGKQDYVVII